MPNHVSNVLTIRGKESRIDDLREFAKGPNPEFKESRFDAGLRVRRNREGGKPDDFKPEPVIDELQCHKFVPVPQDVLDSGYGEKDSRGYNWCCDNWGTKWGCYDIETSYVSGDGDYAFLTYSFHSAWAPPLLVIDAMAAKYPCLKFRLEWFDPCDAKCHVILWRKGARIEKAHA